MQSLAAQRGISYWGIMALIMFVAFGIKLFTALFPAYTDDVLVNKVVTERLNSASLDASPAVLEKELAQQFNMNSLTTLNPREIFVITNRNGGNQVVKKYEVRKPLIANIDLVVKFEKTFDQRVATIACIVHMNNQRQSIDFFAIDQYIDFDQLGRLKAHEVIV